MWYCDRVALCRICGKYSTIKSTLRYKCKGEPEGNTAGYKDRELLRRVLGHCRNGELQRFIAVAEEKVFTPLESVRRWGLTCDCPEHRALEMLTTME